MRDSVALTENSQGLTVVNWPRLQLLMEQAEVDVVVASTPVNVTYISDFWSLSHWTRRSAQVFAIAGRARERTIGLVIPLGNADLVPADHARAPAFVESYDRFVFEPPQEVDPELEPEEAQLLRLVAAHPSGERGPVDALAAAIRHVGGNRGRVAVEYDGLLHGDDEQLRSLLPDAHFSDGLPLLRMTRALKTPEEVRRLRRAASITAEAFRKAVAATHVGDSELDVQRRFHAAMALEDGTPFLTSICSGPRTALPNGQAGRRQLKEEDGIRFDGGCRYQHYASDVARMAAFEAYPSKHRTYHHAVVNGLHAAVGVARAGARAADVYAAAVDAVRRSGIPHYARSHCGHGIGIENYDAPRITSTSDELLEAGMVICLETPYYEIGWGGVQAEDTFLVTEGGLDPFTTTPLEPLPAGTD